MGAECCNESKIDAPVVEGAPSAATGGAQPALTPKAVAVVQKDLPSVSLEGKDAYEKFELSLPFCRTQIKTFAANIAIAEAACEGEGYVTLDQLTKVFTSPAWAQLTQNDSKLCKVLLHDALKDANKAQGPDQIDATWLMCYGVILCSGTPKEKAEVFYGILQDGGLAAHSFISAADKDLPPAFEKMCLLSTVHLFEFAREFTNLDCPFEDYFDKLREAHEDLREDRFLDEVYGESQSKLDNEPWLEAVTKKSKWIFNSKDLRKAVFEQAKVKYEL